MCHPLYFGVLCHCIIFSDTKGSEVRYLEMFISIKGNICELDICRSGADSLTGLLSRWQRGERLVVRYLIHVPWPGLQQQVL